MAIAGLEFEDIRCKSTDWPVLKPKMPLGALPVLEVNGELLPQSNAMLRYVGQLGGLYPDNPLDAFRVDQLIDTLDDMYMTALKDEGLETEKLRESRERFCRVDVPRYVGMLEKQIKERGKEPFFLGTEVSVADLKINQLFDCLSYGFLKFVDVSVLEKYTALAAISKSVDEIPAVKKWNDLHKGQKN